MYSDIGKTIKQARIESTLSQKQLTAYLHINQSTLSRIENGSRSPATTVIEKCKNLFGLYWDRGVLKRSTLTISPKQYIETFSVIDDEAMETIAAINKIILNLQLLETIRHSNKRK